mmetsp:Transcript_21819/g.37249  ORF Transcript_21819/g.37249 Transcript_21819/m.37249 type:complete len:172 (+) Transcript_21819:90-605(+)|eukprot:CAMPEP_0119107904 /NCGR_PEP_ID=MMETSP1180-20130426/12289_1 /TAXON_ID=3052 ORGANISM="Chlamydomonas cf sp, Strain CCMP681" /NCGR_SAMPLE_ID=MMETSP1180 /ASSEMBLY_ACC=CAM_ASM_000741 /LENGTH=171 /DNA_ID=CAMNT_0007093453 /DNA_START=68 /DNA_END=583 /DNA_ORIENTATION=+
MNWPKPPPEPVPRPSGQDDDGPRNKMAMPPQCPRCESTKSQFTRTIQNYQKAYRKKVEGLKTELKSTRNTNDSLRKQVRQLKSITRVHGPSLIVGALAGALIFSLHRLFAKKADKAQAAAPAPSEVKASVVELQTVSVTQDQAADILADSTTGSSMEQPSLAADATEEAEA